MNELETARRSIDRIDREMAKLFERRLECVRSVAKYKKENGLPVFDAAREAHLLETNVQWVAQPYRAPYRLFLQGTMHASKAYQYAQDDAETIGSCPIHFEQGGRHRATLFNLNRKVLIVTDSGVPTDYADAIASQCREAVRFVFPMGEAHKTLQTVEKICTVLQENMFTRADCIVTVGGGVVGDVGGFAASCYMRGIDFYQVPTTLLAQADASVGGKTAVNLNGIKNSVGAFYLPKAVLIDTETLRTLPERRMAEGMAEMIKMALTLDGELFEQLENGSVPVEKAVRAAVQMKKKIVESDLYEQDLRRVLNFGHTIGHAVESVSDLHHGECVALGMLPMCAPAVRERLRAVLKRYNLPVHLPVPKEKIYPVLRYDKKMQTDGVAAVFCEAVGTYEIRRVPLSEVERRVQEMR